MPSNSGGNGTRIHAPKRGRKKAAKLASGEDAFGKIIQRRKKRAKRSDAGKPSSLRGTVVLRPDDLPIHQQGFALLLRLCRVRLGLTLEQASRKTGISAAYLGQLETGIRTDPSLSVTVAVATVYKIDFSTMLKAWRVSHRAAKASNACRATESSPTEGVQQGVSGSTGTVDDRLGSAEATAS